MSTNTIEMAVTTQAQPKRKRAANKSNSTKKAHQPKKATRNPKADRVNKKAEVIALMKRARGATLAEFIAATRLAGAHRAWLGRNRQQGRGKIESAGKRRGRAHVLNREIAVKVPPKLPLFRFPCGEAEGYR